jgi:hypothetical protein
MEHRRPESIPGYEHPDNAPTAEGALYKTFTEGLKPKKNETFGTTSVQSRYSQYSHGETDTQTCPTCSEIVIDACPCAYNDRHCSNGHIWYIDRCGTIKLGN